MNHCNEHIKRCVSNEYEHIDSQYDVIYSKL
jgi:hypothetical protein